MVGSSTDNAGVEVDGAVTPVSVPVPVVTVDKNGAQVQERRGRAGTLAVDEANARLRMPAPRAKDAPSFKGKNVTEFLEDLERAAETAGLDF
ncbi:hypothetical protein H0H92_015117 [Tricholoma furcatifolium]|nr:hypothetical protein H0H92_015117 [Tricholoma furcatifolium]